MSPDHCWSDLIDHTERDTMDVWVNGAKVNTTVSAISKSAPKDFKKISTGLGV